MLTLLTADDLKVKSEQEIFEAVVAWLKGQAEPVSEEEQLKMFALVRFPLMSQDFVKTVGEREPVLSTHRGCEMRLLQF